METKSSCSDESDSLKKYFKDVKKSVILTQEEEINLASSNIIIKESIYERGNWACIIVKK
jgi:hypothetical protein